MFFLIAKIAQRLRALPPDPLHNTLELHQFGQHAAQFATLFKHDHFNYWFKFLCKVLVAAVRFCLIQ